MIQLHGSEIDIAVYGGIKSMKELAALEIFSHLPNAEQANKDLFEILNPKKEKPKQEDE